MGLKRAIRTAVLATLIGTAIGYGGTLTYQVNQGISRPIGIDGATVAGTVQTDGMTGTLTASDILTWNIVVTDGLGGSFDLTNANSTLTLAGTATTATATQLQFNFGSGPPWGTLGYFDLLENASPGWGWEFAVPPDTSLEEVLPVGGNGDAGLLALSPQPLTIGNVLVPLALQGGTASEPVLLLGSSVGGITGTISGLGAEDYYSFFWAGGPFSATATIIGASAGASYVYSAGVAGSCSNVASQTLNSGDGFSSSIWLGSLAPGQYCIGLDANNPNDPNFSLTFNTAVSGVPEPSGLLLVSAGIGLIGARRFAKRSREPCSSGWFKPAQGPGFSARNRNCPRMRNTNF